MLYSHHLNSIVDSSNDNHVFIITVIFGETCFLELGLFLWFKCVLILNNSLISFHNCRTRFFLANYSRTMKFRKRTSMSNLLLERFRSNSLTNWIFRFPTAYEHIVFMIKVLNFKFQKKIISNIEPWN